MDANIFGGQTVLIRTEFTPLATRLAGTNGLNYAGFRTVRPVAEGNSFAAVLASQNNQNKTQSSPPDGIPSIILGPGIYHAYSEELARGPDFSRLSPNATEADKYVMRLSWEHNLKYFDFSSGISLEQVIDSGKNADYTGMSDAEKYMTIFNRYAQAFGENFANWAGTIYITDSNSIFSRVRHEFNKEVIAAFGTSEKATQAYRTALYGNMSENEVRAAIAAKYPPANKMTLRDFMYMVIEMNEFGVDGGLSRVLDSALSFHDLLIAGQTGVNTHFVREGLLDQRLDLSRICNGYNSRYMAGTVSIQTGFLLQDLLGISLDGKGYASTPPSLDYLNWDELIKQWATNYLRWTDEEHEEFFFLKQLD